ncbi:MAG: hypothetical protein ACXVPC_09225, partial [Tumebacillaceae bacterium]
SDVTTADYGYTSFTMNLTGEGFTNDSTVVIDGLKTVTAWKQDSKHLYFSMPTGLLPGTHSITVATSANGPSANALGFNVYPFTADVSLTTPGVRTGTYKANLTIQNHDQYNRNAQVLLVIRRNGLYVETKTVSYSFVNGESKSVVISFGGGSNSPYTNGRTNNISVQAFVVDGTNLAPLCEPATLSQDLYL